MAQLAAKQNVVLVVDAINESEDFQTVISLLVRLRARSIRVLFTSRPSPTMGRIWDSTISLQSFPSHEVVISSATSHDDIRKYVSDTLDDLISSKAISLHDPELRAEIVKTLTKRSDGM